MDVCKLQTVGMPQKAKRPREPQVKNHLREWREYRKKTQQEIADAIGTAHSVISLLEAGKRKLSDKWIRRLAPALKTRPGFLRDYSPEDIDMQGIELFVDLAPEKKQQAIEILKVFYKK